MICDITNSLEASAGPIFITGLTWKHEASGAHKVVKISQRYWDMLVFYLNVHSVTYLGL